MDGADRFMFYALLFVGLTILLGVFVAVFVD